MSDQIRCELQYIREVWRKDGFNTWKRVNTADRLFPEHPVGFVGMQGPYARVAAEASRLNDQQRSTGEQVYIYFPEPVGAPLYPAHYHARFGKNN